MIRFSLPAATSAAFLALAAPLFAHDGVHVEDAYIRASGATATSGAAFMVIVDHGTSGDRLIAATSDVAERVELHRHETDANGVMRMIHVEEGFEVSPGGSHVLERGGDHVMFLGLTRPLADGDIVTVTFTFEREGEVVVDIPVDNARKPDQGKGHGHGHGN
ncbi:MAG: copper chaperone PCu(A)C [Pseudorhodobacter sp.]